MTRPYATLEGTVERITYVNEENQYVVARLEVPGLGELATVVGNLASVSPGETLRLRGAWVSHKKYGEQFQVESYESVAPATLTGIERYLGSGLIKGIGPVFARRLVQAFGLDTLRIIEEEADRLREVDGIGPVRLDRIRRAWEEQREIRNVMLFLQGHGVSSTYAVKIYKTYGARAIAVVRENPYRLAQDIYGIGFKTADRIAQNLGVPRDAPLRAQAGLLYVLNQLTEDGHVYFPRGRLLDEAHKILEIERPALEAALEALRQEARVVGEPAAGDEAVYLKPLYVAEENVARRLADLSRAPRLHFPIDVERAIRWAEENNGLTLADRQREAIRRAVDARVLVITGGPGTGKTTILRCLIQILEKKHQRIVLCAPTGRAAKRMSEATGREAKTIHRLLEWSPGESAFKRDQHRPLEADLVIVDEASMIDVVLMNSLLRAIPLQAGLILVGDADQLPSVGPGTVFRDIIASGCFPVIALNEIFRQAEASLIVVNAHRVNQGTFPLLPEEGAGRPADFRFVAEEDPERVQAQVVDLVATRLRDRFGLSPDEVQVITPMHRGPMGAAQLNTALQAALNPRGEEVVRGTRVFRVGDRVMQLRNNYDKDVYNGDIGRIVRLDREEQEVVLRLDEREVRYEFSDLDELALAYAVTVHKSQGCEYPAVVMPIHVHHYMMLQRNLLYTAISRAKRLLILVGTKKAVAIALKNAQAQGRYTALRERLRATAGAAAGVG